MKQKSFSSEATRGRKREIGKAFLLTFLCLNFFFPACCMLPDKTHISFSSPSLSCLRMCLCVTVSLINAKRGWRSLRRKTNKPNRHVVYTSLPPISFLNKPTHNKQTLMYLSSPQVKQCIVLSSGRSSSERCCHFAGRAKTKKRKTWGDFWFPSNDSGYCYGLDVADWREEPEAERRGETQHWDAY